MGEERPGPAFAGPGQPKLKASLEQLEAELRSHPEADIVLYPEGGEILLDRAKYEAGGVTELDSLRIAFLLCDELVLQGLPAGQSVGPDLIVHPSGVGMFSQAQFDEWVEKARQIARANHAIMIGTSHADGSFRDSEVSLPIAYCIDSSGEDVFISNSDVRSRLLNFDTHDVIIVPDAGEASAGG